MKVHRSSHDAQRHLCTANARGPWRHGVLFRPITIRYKAHVNNVDDEYWNANHASQDYSVEELQLVVVQDMLWSLFKGRQVVDGVPDRLPRWLQGSVAR